MCDWQALAKGIKWKSGWDQLCQASTHMCPYTCKHMYIPHKDITSVCVPMRTCVCMVWVGVPAKMCTCSSEENFVELISSFHPPLGGSYRSNSGYQTCTARSFTCWAILCFLLLPFLLFFLNWHVFIVHIFIKGVSLKSIIFSPCSSSSLVLLLIYSSQWLPFCFLIMYMVLSSMKNSRTYE